MLRLQLTNIYPKYTHESRTIIIKIKTFLIKPITKITLIKFHTHHMNNSLKSQKFIKSICGPLKITLNKKKTEKPSTKT